MPHNRFTQGNETLFPNWQKESWLTFQETSGYVRPERVNKWPNYMTYDDDDDTIVLQLPTVFATVKYRTCL